MYETIKVAVLPVLIGGVIFLLSHASWAGCPDKLPAEVSLSYMKDTMRDCTTEIIQLRDKLKAQVGSSASASGVRVTAYRIGPEGAHIPGKNEGEFRNVTGHEVANSRNLQICTLSKVLYTSPDYCELVKKDDGTNAWYINAGPNARCQVTCFKIEVGQ